MRKQNGMGEDLLLSLSPEEEYGMLQQFFFENHLEVDTEEVVPTDLVQSWKITRRGDDQLVGAMTLARRQGEYIIDGIAVSAAYRDRDLGSNLLDLAVSLIRKQGGGRIYLVARAPEFFRKFGFSTVPQDQAPNFFECMTCPQYGVDCHPEVMQMEV